MKKISLLNEFIETLNNNTSKRSELVYEICDLLNIEKESAYRRLGGRVQFTVDELGILAKKYGISIDNLLYEGYRSVSFKMSQPLKSSVNHLKDELDGYLQNHENRFLEKTELGAILNSMPLEFYIPYPHLLKFMYFKWGHHFIGTEEYNDYANWHVPKVLSSLNVKLMDVYERYEKVLYIWNVSVIWNLMKELNYFYKMHLLNNDDFNLIKQDLHDIMCKIEKIVSGTGNNELNSGKVFFFISNVDIGICYSYLFSEKDCSCFFKSYFVQSTFINDSVICTEVRNWIYSLMKVSTLISGSGEKERRLFFEEQHKIIDSEII